MEALRLVIRQNSANYRREETVLNKQTYPLPPFSTVIGALHAACGFKSYQKMDISIQGEFESMHRETYVDHCFLNSLQDDRGILVKMKNNDLLSKAFERVAESEKQGSSFYKGESIRVSNEHLLAEYRQLKLLKEVIRQFKNERIKNVQESIKKRKKTLAAKKKNMDKKSDAYIRVQARELEIKQLERRIKTELAAYEHDHYTSQISKFQTLTTAPMYYETLNQIQLILHIRSDAQTLSTIEENIYRLKSIGRSEDFVEVVDAKRVVLSTTIQGEVTSRYSAYLDYDLVRSEHILLSETKSGIPANGTTYYLNKNYEIINNQRIFEKKKVVYTSFYIVDELGDDLFLDETAGQTYIVNFI